MRTCNFSPVSSLLSLLFFGLFGSKAIAADGLADHSKGMQFTRPLLRFEINEGQSAAPVRFTVRDRDGIAFLTDDGAVFQIAKGFGPSEARTPGKKPAALDPDTQRLELSFVRMKHVGSNPNPRAIGLDRVPGVTNYFLGSDPAKWRTGIPGYAKVKYENVYPGIDLIYYGSKDGLLEYDFIVAPGADPDLIALSIEDARKVEVDQSGALVITAATGMIRKPAPHVYQEINGERRKIAAGYRLANPSDEMDSRQVSLKHPRVAFALGAYDQNRPLVIDPQVIYATYLGGSSTSTVANEGARGVAVDAQGSVYIVGVTQSADFPTENPAQTMLLGSANAFVTKLDGSGQLVYSTYLGGNGFDEAAAIKVDDTGAAYVGGTTTSSNFPLVNALQSQKLGGSDAFLTKLSASGSQIVYSTYLGGNDLEGVTGLALDAQKNLYVVGNITPAGLTPATNFPTVNPIQPQHGGGARDGFLSILGASGTMLLSSTYLGGDGDDFLQSISLDQNSMEVFLAFFTDSSNFPPSSLSPALQGLVAAEAQPGAMAMNVLVTNNFILIVDKTGRIAFIEPSVDKTVFGVNIGLGFIELSNRIGQGQPGPGLEALAPPAGGLDARLDVLDQNLAIAKTTYFGGSGEDTFSEVVSDSRGAIYIVGRTRSTNLPLINPIQAIKADTFDGFLAVLAPKTLQPLFSTYLGGANISEALNGVTVDPQGNIYVVGETFGNFPTTTPGALDSQFSGRTDAFVIKISPVTIPLAAAVDFDNDGKSDIGIYRDGTWVVIRSSNGSFLVDSLGGATEFPITADYDGDGKHDIAVYRQSTGLWTIKRSSDGGITSVSHGGGNFIPVPGDYDGDGKTDMAVYADGVWSIKRSSDGGIQVVAHGGPGWTPVAADYDGDGKTDIAVYINGAWSILQSSNSAIAVVGHGGPSWEPVPADYDGDGKADVAAYTAGAWSIIRSNDSGNTVLGHGGPSWLPVPADYDGDFKADIAVYNSAGAWSIVKSTNSSIQVVGHGGGPTDVPLN